MALAPGLVAPAQAVETPTPMSHTIDYILASTSANTGYLSTADLQTRTDKVSQEWNRMSRGVVTDMKLGQVFTLPNYTGVICAMYAHNLPADVFEQALGYSMGVYQGNNNGRHLVILFPEGTIQDACDHAGNALTLYSTLSSSGIIEMDASQSADYDALVLTHELGHVFGLMHASATLRPCIARFWDGPFLAGNSYAEADGCPTVNTYSTYGDELSVMGNSHDADRLDINGYFKAKLGLIQPGSGLKDVTAGAEEQLVTIHDATTQDLNQLQSVRLTADDPDGPGDCLGPAYHIDYNGVFGGVQILRVRANNDCGTKLLRAYTDTFAWTVPTDDGKVRSYFLPGESRVTADGKIQIRVVSIDAGAKTATIGIRRTDVPGFSTVQMTAGDLPANNQQQVDAAGGQLAATVTTNQSSWSATSDQSWVTATSSGTTGADLVVTAQPNQTARQRTAVVTVRAGSATTAWTLVQQPGPSGDDCGASLNWGCGWRDLASPAQGRIDAAGDKDWFKFSPTVSGTWSFTVTAGDGSAYLAGGLFRSTIGTDGEYSVKADSTSEKVGNGRDYFLQVSGEGGGASSGTYTITATPPQSQIKLSKDSLSFLGDGNTAVTGTILSAYSAVTVTANTLWRMGPLPDWLNTPVTTGSGSTTVEFYAAPNMGSQARTWTVTFSGGGQEVSLLITQDPASPTTKLSLSTESWDAPAAGGTVQVKVTSDGPWTVTLPDWVSGVTGSSSGAGPTILVGGNARTVELTPKPNLSGSPRVGTATISGGGISKQVTINQPSLVQPTQLSVSRDQWAPLAAGESTTIDVTANGDWTVSVPSWITASPASGKGNGQVTLTAQANTGASSRTDPVTFTSGAVTAKVSVTQAGAAPQFMTVDPTSQSVLAQGGAVTVQVTAGVSWSVTVPPGVRANPARGTGNGSVTLTVDPNTGGARVLLVTITSYNATRVVTITQDGAPVQQLTVSPLKWDAPAEGGSQWVQVNTTARWTVTVPDGIVTADVLSGYGNGWVKLTVARNNTGGQRTLSVTVRTGDANQVVVISQPAVTGDDCGSTNNTACTWGDISTPVRGSVETQWDFDRFRFTVTPDQAGRWTFTSSTPGANPLGNPLGWIMDGSTDGLVLAVDDDSAGNYQFKMTVNLEAGKTYYLQVTANGPSTGDYMVTATRT